MDERIKLIRSCTWEEVFLTWYENEGKNPNWINLAKERGFSSWANWRIKGYAQRFECAQAEWSLYEISQSGVVISNWYGGPFRTWIDHYYDGKKTKSFSELTEHPQILNHSGVQGIMKDYPKESVITALQLVSGDIFVIEGSHRACALALLAKQNHDIENPLIFAIGKSNLSELPTVGKNTKQ